MKRFITPLIIVAVVVVGGFFLSQRLKAASPVEKTQFKLAKVELGMVKKTVSATGTLMPWRVIDIKSKAGGRVDTMSVDVGSEVKAGTVICNIDPTDTRLQVDQAKADIELADASILQSQHSVLLQEQQSKLAVKQAEASLASARANLNAARARRNTAEFQKDAQPALTKANIESAQANVESLEKQLAEMQQATHPQARSTAQSNLAQAEANQRNAVANLTRQKNLIEKGFVSQAVVDQAQANAEVMAAQVSSAKRKLDTLDREQAAAEASVFARIAQAKAQLQNAKTQGIDVQVRASAFEESKAAVKQLEHQIENAQATLDLANQNLRNITIRKQDVKTAQARRARAEAAWVNANVTLRQTTVTAPTAGVILKKYVEQGTIISSALSFAAAGNNIVQLGDITRMYVDVTVDETDIANVDIGQAVDVTIEAYPSTPFEGKVIRIDPQAEVIQNVTMVHVRVEIDNSDATFQLLKPGMNATCEFVIDKKDDVLAVPAEAVRTDDNGKYVEIGVGGVPYVAPKGEEDNADPEALQDVRITRRPVKVGIEGNETVEVIEGVKEGDMVVTKKIEPTPKASGSPFAQQRMGGIRTQPRTSTGR